MRILGIGDWNDLGDMYLRLASEEHEVRVHIAEPEAHDILEGMICRVDDWRESLPWIREAGRDGFIIFETAGMGELQDELRRDGFQVVGGSAFGDRLERDRGFGQEVLRAVGMSTAASWSFPDAAGVETFICAHPGRYVLKYDSGSDLVCQTYVGRAGDGSDLLALLAARRGLCAGRHLLMEHVDGVELGIGAYFNGERFLAPACLDWEHKRFFPGDLGELTGEMGTLVTYGDSEELFARTLGRLEPALRAGGYQGYINLNTIIDQRGIWPLEFTSRFGYPGYAILSALQPDGWPDLLQRMVDRGSTGFRVLPGYAVGVVITVPPFPYHYGYECLGKGTAIAFTDLTSRDQEHLHLGEVAQRDGQLRCAGVIGAILTVTGSGRDVAAARLDAYGRVARVVIPNMRYRADIGERFIARDAALLRAWGHLR
jgi:phosphoribosylamine--glycine ligase